MKVIVISYSLTGNNDALATAIAAELGAKHIKVTEEKSRTTATILFDILFNRTPKVIPMPGEIGDSDLVIFVSPVWMGQIATPLRAYFKHFKDRAVNYAFVSISGGADGPNPKLAGELAKRMGKEPATLIDLHIASLLPPDPKPTREVTMAYRLSEAEVKGLTGKIVKTLRETVVK
jgi:flavodoxin